MIVSNDSPLYPALERFFEYAQERIAAGAVVPDIVEEGIQRYCQDGQFVRQLVVDAMRFAALGAATGRGLKLTAPRTDDDPSDLSNGAESALAELANRQHEAHELRQMRIQARSRTDLLKLIAEQGTSSSPVAKFFELHPSTRVPVKLLTLTREELLAAATRREQESEYSRRRAILCREMASRLLPGQRAEEIWKESDIASLEQKILDREQPTPIRTGIA
jgi:hypothetical protein